MMNKKSYIIRRLIQSVLTIYVIITLTFFMFRLMPGDPISMLLTGELSQEAREMIRRSWGLDKSLWEQYLIYFMNLFKGEFGVSFYYKIDVWKILQPRLVNTLILLGTSMTLSVFIGITIGAPLGWRRNTRWEKGGILFFLSLRSIPIFWMGILLLMVFSYWLKLFPGGDMHSTGFMADGFFANFFNLDFLKHFTLPFICALLYSITDPLTIMRSSMLEIKGEDFLTILEAKGLPRFQSWLNVQETRSCLSSPIREFWSGMFSQAKSF